MARTDITVTDGGYGMTLMTETAADQANGMSFSNDGRTILVVSNEDASAKTVTIAVNSDEFGRDVTESVTIPAGRISVSNFFPPSVYNQAANKVHLDFDADTSVKVAAFRMKG